MFRYILNLWCFGLILWLIFVISVIVVWYILLVLFIKGKNFIWWLNDFLMFVLLKNVSLGMVLKINIISFKFVLLIFYWYI